VGMGMVLDLLTHANTTPVMGYLQVSATQSPTLSLSFSLSLPLSLCPSPSHTLPCATASLNPPAAAGQVDLLPPLSTTHCLP